MMWRRGWFLIFVFASLVHPAFAHPHVFMDCHVTIQCDDAGVKAIEVSLLYDEMYSQTRWDTFDTHHTGKMSTDDMRNLVKNEKEIFDQDGPFTWLKLDGHKIPTEKPIDYTVTMEGRQMRITYVVPCRVPVTTKDRELCVSICDYQFFYQITYVDQPVSVVGNTRFSIACRIEENEQETYYFGQMHPVEIILQLHPGDASSFSLHTETAAEKKHPAPIVWQNPPTDEELDAEAQARRSTPMVTYQRVQSSTWLNRIAIWQRDLKEKMTRMIDNARDEHSIYPIVWLLVLAFIYGIIHAAGPGHGKVITVSYLLTNKPRLSDCLLFGNLIALFHGLSGITLVLIAHFITTLKNARIDILSRGIGIASYGFTILIGVWLLWRVIKNKGCCEPQTAAKISPRSRTTLLVTKNQTTRDICVLAFSVGIIPCPGTMLIMLFCMTAGVTALGVWMSVCETIGMVTTISTVGILTVLGKKIFVPSADGTLAVRFNYWLSICGAALIILFSLVLLFASLI